MAKARRTAVVESPEVVELRKRVTALLGNPALDYDEFTRDECESIARTGDEEALTALEDRLKTDIDVHSMLNSDSPRVSKAEAMRRALKELGMDAKNEALEAWILDKHGLTITNTAVLKSNMKRKLLEESKPAAAATPTLFSAGDQGQPTLAELKKLRTVATDFGGLTAMAETVGRVEVVANQFGGLPRLQIVIRGLRDLLGDD